MAGLNAKTYLSSRILDKIVLVKFKKEEKYGRLLGTIYYKGCDICNEMITKGHAKPYFGEKKTKFEEVVDIYG